MAEYDFYLTSKQIKSQTKDNIRGSWKLARQGALVLYLIFAVLVVTTVLLSIFVKWWISIPLGIVSYILLTWERRTGRSISLSVSGATYSGRYPFSVPVMPVQSSMAITVQVWMAVAPQSYISFLTPLLDSSKRPREYRK